MEEKTVIVLGNARSGTSMISGILSILGVNMNQQDNPHRGNPKGSFEDVDFLNVTMQMRMDMMAGIPLAKIRETYICQIEDLLHHRRGLWGWKSALTHYSIDLFLPLLTNPHLVFVFRNFVHNSYSFVVHQLERYGKCIAIEDAFLAISDSTHVLIQKFLQYPGLPKALVTYEDTKGNPVGVAQKLADFLQVRFTAEMDQRVREFIMPEYSTLKGVQF